MLKSMFLFGKGELFIVSLQCKTKDNTNKKGLPIEIGATKDCLIQKIENYGIFYVCNYRCRC